MYNIMVAQALQSPIQTISLYEKATGVAVCSVGECIHVCACLYCHVRIYTV